MTCYVCYEAFLFWCCFIEDVVAFRARSTLVGRGEHVVHPYLGVGAYEEHDINYACCSMALRPVVPCCRHVTACAGVAAWVTAYGYESSHVVLLVRWYISQARMTPIIVAAAAVSGGIHHAIYMLLH